MCKAVRVCEHDQSVPSMTWTSPPHSRPLRDGQTAIRNTGLFTAGQPRMINDLQLGPGWQVSWVLTAHTAPPNQ